MLDAKPLLDWTGGPAFAWVVGAALLYWLGGRRTAHSRRKRPRDTPAAMVYRAPAPGVATTISVVSRNSGLMGN